MNDLVVVLRVGERRIVTMWTQTLFYESCLLNIANISYTGTPL